MILLFRSFMWRDHVLTLFFQLSHFFSFASKGHFVNMSRMNVQPSEVKSKDKIPYARMKVSKRRPKDHPKRPLSACKYCH